MWKLLTGANEGVHWKFTVPEASSDVDTSDLRDLKQLQTAANQNHQLSSPHAHHANFENNAHVFLFKSRDPVMGPESKRARGAAAIIVTCPDRGGSPREEPRSQSRTKVRARD